MDTRSLVKQIYDAVERDNVENAVMHCIRLAKGIRDIVSAALFLRDTGLDGKQVVRVLYDDLKDLKKETLTFVMEKSGNLWIEERTLDFSLGRDDRGDEQRIVATAVGDMDFQLRQATDQIAKLVAPPGMTPYDTAAFTDSYEHRRAKIQLLMSAIQRVRQRIKIRCFNYAVSIERQLDAQQRPEAFMQRIQTDVNNFFRTRSADVYAKLEKAAQLVNSPSPEDQSLLLTQVRRAIKAAADFFYPPQAGKVICSDGVERDLSDERYLNRLTEYVQKTFPRSAAGDLLRAELDYFIAFAKRLNDLASKGVHAQVSTDEARQGLLGLYMFLYNIIAKLERKELSPQGMNDTTAP